MTEPFQDKYIEGGEVVIGQIYLTKRELTYLRHKAWHFKPTWYWYITARELPRTGLFGFVDYLFMSGMEQDKVIDILKSYRGRR